MSRIKSKFIKWGTGSGDVNASSMPANRTATNYTPSDSTVKGHLDGVDSAIGAAGGSLGDIGQTSFSAANNQSSPASVIGLAFANGTVRSFQAIVSVYINATASLYEQFILNGIQKGSSWEMSTTSVGDSSGINFSITNAGQVQYTSANTSGFVSNTIKFRALTTSV